MRQAALFCMKQDLDFSTSKSTLLSIKIKGTMYMRLQQKRVTIVNAINMSP